MDMGSPLTLISDPRVLAIRIAESGEALTDARTLQGIRVDNRKRDAAELWAKIRVGIGGRLATAQDSLPDGVRLLFIEGLRPVATQRRYFTAYVRRLAGENPTWSAERVYDEAVKYVAPPDAVPPHSTGGAVDVTLVTAGGDELDLGTPVNASPAESAGACFTDAAAIPAAARANRQLLCNAMQQAGFVNYGTEWWHWSYGDRYWAFVTGAAAACYGTAQVAAD